MMNSGLTSRRLRDLLRLCAPRKREGERILAATTTTLAPNHTLQFSSFTYSNSNSSASAPKANIIIRGRLHKLQINSQLQRASSDMSFCFWDRGEKFKDHFEPGVYVCSKCGYELFSSKQKFDHHSPWPAFTKTIHSDSVTKYPESRTALKVKCGKCGNPLGHEFLGDGPEGASRF